MKSSLLKLRVEIPLEELQSLEGALQRATVEPEQVGRALAAAGSLLRRLNAARTDLSRIRNVLTRLPSDAVRVWSTGVEPSSIEARLHRATEEAMEAALPESNDEQDTWRAWAREGVEARDVLESQLVAMRFREGLGFEGDAPSRVRLGEGLLRQDRALKLRARWLVSLNEWRREERDLLDPEHRSNAWWFVERADCESLLPALAGELTRAEHLRTCPQCRDDLQAVRGINARRERHLSEDELWRFDLGMFTQQERAYLERHIQSCGECAQAVSALDVGEEAIRELTVPRTGTATVIDIRSRLRPKLSEPEVLADNPHFRLLLFRREQARVVVQPKGAHRLAAAALHFVEQPHRTIAARAGLDGIGFDVGALSGAFRVRARFTGMSEDVECDVDL